jgi:hypothetical protein
MKFTENVTVSLGVWVILLVIGVEALLLEMLKYSKTSLIQTNRERTLVQISESPNYRSATENMFREVIKWTSCVCLGNTTLF